MPQHFLPGVSDISSGAFPVGMFAPLQSVPSNVAQTDKPTAAQAAAGRLQRASARQAAKAAQQQKRQAQARASAASKTEGAGSRRKREDDGAVEEAERDGRSKCQFSTGRTYSPSNRLLPHTRTFSALFPLTQF